MSERRRRSSRPPGALPPRLETSAGGVVFRRDGDGRILVLLIRDPYANWGLPKGHVEPGETPKQAAVREVTEETALSDLRPIAELPTIDWYFRDKGEPVHKFCHFFLMESPHGAAQPRAEEGISACLWLPLRDAIRRITYDNARQVLLAARGYFDAPAATGRPSS